MQGDFLLTFIDFLKAKIYNSSPQYFLERLNTLIKCFVNYLLFIYLLYKILFLRSWLILRSLLAPSAMWLFHRNSMGDTFQQLVTKRRRARKSWWAIHSQLLIYFVPLSVLLSLCKPFGCVFLASLALSYALNHVLWFLSCQSIMILIIYLLFSLI